MNIWAVANQKGGVGKTTSTVTLGGLLAGSGEETLMIDLDPHASLSAYFKIEPEDVDKGIYDLFMECADNKKINSEGVIHHTKFDKLSLIPSSPALATLEKKLGSRNGMGLMLSQILD